MEARTIAGPTLRASFAAAPEARRRVLDLHRAGFGEDQVGYSAGPAEAVVTVLPGDRREEALAILGGGHRHGPGAALRRAVARALGRT